jgi:hypothetical protein
MGETKRTFDFGDEALEDTEETLGDNAMTRLAGLAKDQVDAEALVAAMEERLKEAQDALNDIYMKRLPDLMDDLELTDFSTKNGLKIKLRQKIRGSIPKDNESEAFKWLEDHDNGNMIKRQFVIQFGLAEEGWARKFMADCRKRKKSLNMKVDRKVPAPTLQSWVSNQLEEGAKIPMELFGVWRQRFTKVEIGSK